MGAAAEGGEGWEGEGRRGEGAKRGGTGGERGRGMGKGEPVRGHERVGGEGAIGVRGDGALFRYKRGEGKSIGREAVRATPRRVTGEAPTSSVTEELKAD